MKTKILLFVGVLATLGLLQFTPGAGIFAGEPDPAPTAETTPVTPLTQCAIDKIQIKFVENIGTLKAVNGVGVAFRDERDGNEFAWNIVKSGDPNGLGIASITLDPPQELIVATPVELALSLRFFRPELSQLAGEGDVVINAMKTLMNSPAGKPERMAVSVVGTGALSLTESEKQYTFPITDYCNMPNYDRVNKTLHLDGDANKGGQQIQIPAIRKGILEIANLQAIYADTDYGFNNVTLTLQNGTTATKATYTLDIGQVSGEIESEKTKHEIEIWKFDKNAPTTVTLKASKGGKTYHLGIAKTASDKLSGKADLFPWLKRNTLLTYSLTESTQFIDAMNKTGVIFSVDQDIPAQKNLTIRGHIFISKQDNAAYELDDTEVFNIANLSRYTVNMLDPTKAKVDLVINNTRIGSVDVEASSAIEIPLFPLAPDGQASLYVNDGTSKCYPVVSYTWTASDSVDLGLPTKLADTPPRQLTLPYKDWNDAESASPRESVVLFVEPNATIDCFNGLADERLTAGGLSTGSPASGTEGDSSVTPISSTQGTDSPFNATAWQSANTGSLEARKTAREAMKYNTYGIHILTEQGSLPNDIDNEACQVGGKWGYVKGLWYPLSNATAAPQDFAKGFVNEAIRMNMIPVLRVATRWNDKGMVAPTFNNELPATKLAALIKQLAEARSDKTVPLLIEAFNEPNLGWDWASDTGVGTNTAAEYAKYVVDLHAAMKAAFGGTGHVKDNVYLVTAGLAPGGNTDGVTTPEAYIEKMKAVTGFVDSFDVWGSQGKLSNNVGEQTQPLPATCEGVTGVDPFHVCQYKDELATLGERGKTVPVFIIESGYSKGAKKPASEANTAFPGVSAIADDRARMTIHAAEIWRADPQVMGTTFWQLADPSGDKPGRFKNWDWAYQTWNDNGTETLVSEIQPVYTAVRDYLGTPALGLANTMCTSTNKPGADWGKPGSASASGTRTDGTAAVQDGTTNLSAVGTSSPSAAVINLATSQDAPQSIRFATFGSEIKQVLILGVSKDGKKYQRQIVASTRGSYSLDKGKYYIIAATKKADSEDSNDYVFFPIPNTPIKSIEVTIDAAGRMTMGIRAGNVGPYTLQDAIACEICDVSDQTAAASPDPAPTTDDALSWLTTDKINVLADAIADHLNNPAITADTLVPYMTHLVDKLSDSLESQLASLLADGEFSVDEAKQAYDLVKEDETFKAIISLIDRLRNSSATSISGKITNPVEAASASWFPTAYAISTPRPVEYAVIEFVGAYQTFVALADADGSFSISVPPADYDVIVTAPGYKTLSGKWIAEDGGHFVGSFQLEPGESTDTGGEFAINAALPLSRFGINAEGQFALQPNPEMAFVYEYRTNASNFQSLSFDYRYLTEMAEGGDIDFKVLLLDGEQSHVLYAPSTLTDGTDWQSANPESGESAIGFTEDDQIDLSLFMGKDISVRFVVSLAEGATFAANSSLANAMELRHVVFRAADQVTTIGYDTPESGREVISLWHPDHINTYLSADPTLVGEEAVTRTLHWMHTNYGWPAPDGTTYQGEIEELDELEACGETYTDVLAVRPSSGEESTYIDLDFTSSAGSALQSVDFSAGGNCDGSGSTDLSIIAIVLGENDEILSENVVWTGESIDAWTVQSISLADYEQKKLVLRIQASGHTGFETFESAYLANLSFQHGSLTTLAATAIPLASIFFTVLPILAIALTIGGLLLLLQLKRK